MVKKIILGESETCSVTTIPDSCSKVVYIYDIDWDVDNAERFDLPSDTFHEFQTDGDEEQLADVISEWLSDEYGFCHCGFKIAIPKTMEENIANWITMAGTIETRDGCFQIPFDEIKDKFRVDLNKDTALRENVCSFFNKKIVADVKTKSGLNLIFNKKFCPYYEDAEN